MAHLTASVEYGLHCLLLLVGADDRPVSGRDLAEYQGISPSFVAKIFARLEKAGIVAATEGVRGGYSLARALEQISVLEIVDAIEGKKPLFDCQDIRFRCAVFEGRPPPWAKRGVCSIHGVMLQAERAMRDVLARQSLADLAADFGQKAPASFGTDTKGWFDRRIDGRAGRRSRSSAAPERDGAGS